MLVVTSVLGGCHVRVPFSPRLLQSWRGLSHPRRLVQVLLLITTLIVGLRFWLFVLQFQPEGGSPGATPAMTGPAAPHYSRPVSVEAFLPIGALIALKAWLTTGWWDPVHPAALVFLLMFAGVAFLLKRGFCSWVCPVGTLSEALARAGRWLFGQNLRPPLWLDRLLMAPKYLLLLFFVGSVWNGMSGVAARQFLATPYWLMADVKMLRFFQAPSLLTVQVLVALAVLSLLVEGFWCRYLCPYGALLGIISIPSPFTIRRNPATCIGCNRCDAVCAARLRVSESRSMRSPECTGCLDCIAACPVRKDTALMLSLPARTAHLGPWSYAVALLCVMFLAIALGQAAGHWQTVLTAKDFGRLVPFVDSFGH